MGVTSNGDNVKNANAPMKSPEAIIIASEALDRLTESNASDWLAAPPVLVQSVKHASEILFSITADSFDNLPLSKLYTDRFDSEQIWQQIDLQSHPVLSHIRRKLKNLEIFTTERCFFGLEVEATQMLRTGVKQDEDENDDPDEDDLEDEDIDDTEAKSKFSQEEAREGEEEDNICEEQYFKRSNVVEDDFFKISEMEKFLERSDVEGSFGTGGEGKQRFEEEEEDDDDHEAEYDDEEIDEQEIDYESLGISGEGVHGDRGSGFVEYEDFFGNAKAKSASCSNSDEINDGFAVDGDGMTVQPESNLAEGAKLSAHELRQKKIEKRMKLLENATFVPKDWTQQGEVTAKRRPKNSALEVELDFEHNVRPQPVMTEEVTASLEDMIMTRIAEEKFDDVQQKVLAAGTALREHTELDESKSNKGLGAIYEVEYMRQSGFAAAPNSASNVIKEEAKELFKALCNRLAAISHFYFAPKPLIQDMGVHTDVPALAVEEVAALAVSEASILAPEEIFVSNEAVRGEGELTPEERKRRRAQKKRKRKGTKKAIGADRISKRNGSTGSAPVLEPMSNPGLDLAHSSYSKSSKVFAELERAKLGKGNFPSKKSPLSLERPQLASFLKL